MAVLHDLTLRWQAGFGPDINALGRRLDMDRTVTFVRENSDWPLTLALLAHVQLFLGDEDKKLVGELADARGLVAARTADYANRYEQARLLLAAGRKEEAASCFLKLYANGLDVGLLPRIDRAFRDALAGGNRWGRLMRETADRLAKANNRLAVITLAWQCRLVDDVPLADSLVALALDHVPAGERQEVTIAAVNYLRPTAIRQADELLRDLTAAEPFASDAGLWRLRTEIAGEMQQGDYAASCLERALALEYRNLPAVIDLREWRGAYKYVLDDCRRLAASARSLGVKASPELVARVVRIADRWRSHDPEYFDACETAAAALSDLGEADLAWDYLTTAVAHRAREPETWHNLATARRVLGDPETAERAYAVACASDPQNARILWDRAQNLLSMHHTAEAGAILRRLADEEWPAEYAPVRELAREQLRRR
jgi:tetratricopeptide (TPR) repeat protein